MKIRNSFVSNSSTSSFICDTRMSEEEIYIKLCKIIEGYNIMTDKNLQLSEVAYVTVVDREYWDDYKYWLGSGDKYSEGYSFKELKDKKVIQGVDDNSIPYAIFDIIEEAFNAQRHHFG